MKKTFTAQVTASNRVTIPHEVAEVLGIKEGDYVEVTVEVEKRR